MYRAPRLGRQGRTYRLLKYRSMKVGSTPLVAGDYKVITLADDRRIAAVGRFLRCSLDELPQLFHVLRGEMAWIGPRPDEPWMLDNYGPLVRQRLSVSPGITGLAQVRGGRRLSTAQSYAVDLWYIRHRSFLLDLWIVLVTPAFIAGWRSVGARRLATLRGNAGFISLQHRCARELRAASAKTTQPAEASHRWTQMRTDTTRC